MKPDLWQCGHVGRRERCSKEPQWRQASGMLLVGGRVSVVDGGVACSSVTLLRGSRYYGGWEGG